MAWVTAVALLALFEYMVFGGMVGRARGKYKVDAPAITGHEVFERYFRVQQNTLEQLVVFLPALFAFGTFTSARGATILGGIFIVGRAIYAASYVSAPSKRGLGFALSALPNLVLVFGGLYGAIHTAVTG